MMSFGSALGFSLRTKRLGSTVSFTTKEYDIAGNLIARKKK